MSWVGPYTVLVYWPDGTVELYQRVSQDWIERMGVHWDGNVTAIEVQPPLWRLPAL